MNNAANTQSSSAAASTGNINNDYNNHNNNSKNVANINNTLSSLSSPKRLSNLTKIVGVVICTTVLVTLFLSGQSDCTTTNTEKFGFSSSNTDEAPVPPPPPPPPEESYAPLAKDSPPGPYLQYEPSKFPWKRGRKFPPGKTPLTMINNGEVPRRVLPDSWDGGYGWVFVKYIPSIYETNWAELAEPIERRRPGLPLCDLIKHRFKVETEKYTSQSAKFTSENGAAEKCNISNFPAAEPVKFENEIFSRFEYVWKCTLPPCRTRNAKTAPKIGTKKYAYIEPLTNLLRHPNTCEDPPYFLANKNYMIVDAWSLMHPSRSTMSPPDPKVIFVDLGASTWNQGWGGASQTWFHAVYEGKCLNFTDWFMFEAERHDARNNVFKLLPGHIKPGYHWYNIFLSTNLGSWDNPLNHLLMEARKEDVVIIKIDFDSPAVEAALLKQIIDFPEIAELIDELYFEHHVNMDVMNSHIYWGTSNLNTSYQSDSIKLFTALRKRGIRAHSWV